MYLLSLGNDRGQGGWNGRREREVEDEVADYITGCHVGRYKDLGFTLKEMQRQYRRSDMI